MEELSGMAWTPPPLPSYWSGRRRGQSRGEVRWWWSGARARVDDRVKINQNGYISAQWQLANGKQQKQSRLKVMETNRLHFK
jgi:hypothetical protein